jgi:hypothetical protein
MLEFVRNAFRKWFSAILWVSLIGCIIAGFVFGRLVLGWVAGRIIGLLLGGVAGTIVGFISIILGGGLISTFLEMAENISILKDNISKTGSSSPLSQGSIPSSGNRSIVGNKLQKKCKRCHKEVDEDYTGCPHCGNNTFE